MYDGLPHHIVVIMLFTPFSHDLLSGLSTSSFYELAPIPCLDVLHHARSMYLFTKSDIKTILIPVVCVHYFPTLCLSNKPPDDLRCVIGTRPLPVVFVNPNSMDMASLAALLHCEPMLQRVRRRSEQTMEANSIWPYDISTGCNDPMDVGSMLSVVIHPPRRASTERHVTGGDVSL